MSTSDRLSHGQEDLAEFFGLLAARFAYERQAAARRGKPRTATGLHRTLRQSVRRQRVLLSLTALLVCLLLVAVSVLTESLEGAELPNDVLGTWRTSAGGYEHRGFTLTPTSLVFNAGLDGKEVSIHRIMQVHATARGAETEYAIEYLINDARYELAFRYSSGPPSVIHLSHQQGLIWWKEGTSRG